MLDREAVDVKEGGYLFDGAVDEGHVRANIDGVDCKCDRGLIELVLEDFLVELEQHHVDAVERERFNLHLGEVADDHLAVDQAERGGHQHHEESEVLLGPLCPGEDEAECHDPVKNRHRTREGFFAESLCP